MGFFKYPYTDLNELNLDWVIEKIKYIEQASHIIYDNTGSGLTADNVQSALDEIVSIIQTTGVTSWNTRVGDVVPQAGDYTAAQVTYDNTNTGYTATDVQAAIDEADAKIEAVSQTVPVTYVETFNSRSGAVTPAAGDYDGSQVTYDNSNSGLTATDLQAAVDELAAAPGGVTSFNNRTGAVVPAASDYDAAQVDFDDTVAQTGSSNVQGALQYVATRGSSAALTTYDNTQSGLTATNVQVAIDEVAQDVLSSGVASFNGRTGAVNPQAGDYDLTELGDVAISSPTNDQVLKYDSVSQKWVNGAEGGGGSSTLAGLTDVSITTPASGQVLTYDGASWENSNLPAIPDELGDLSNVNLVSPVNGQVLKFDGTGWTNAAESGGGADLSKVICPVETSGTASQAYPYGATFIDAQGYHALAISAILLGDPLTLNGNYVRITVDDNASPLPNEAISTAAFNNCSTLEELCDVMYTYKKGVGYVGSTGGHNTALRTLLTAPGLGNYATVYFRFVHVSDRNHMVIEATAIGGAATTTDGPKHKYIRRQNTLIQQTAWANLASGWA